MKVKTLGKWIYFKEYRNLPGVTSLKMKSTLSKAKV